MRFLIIDDSPFDRELIIRKLQDEFSDATFVEVGRQADFEVVVASHDFDVVLVDYGLRWANGLGILKNLRDRFPDVPIVMVTDTGNEEIAVEGMKEGLSDYVLKKHLQRLPFAVKESLEKARLSKERQRLEEQVRQVQKMESLGLLVGGIAHDFNNMLAGITGYAQLGLSQVNQGDAPYEHLYHIHQIAQRATRMTRQLLTFSRQQTLEPSYVNLNTVIAHLQDFLANILTERIDLEFAADPALNIIYADASQIEQVVMNLCINARDAMPDGGKLLIKTQNVLLDESDAATFAGIRPGAYVQLTVADSGVGMDEHVRERMFQPFFTTKELGKGTGLGLSVVLGIITQHHGFFVVDSEPGKGTTFTIYFPSVDHVGANTEREEALVVQGGTETILLVEDDLDVQKMLEDMLREFGYKVITAHDGEEGLTLFEQHASSVDLVLADLLMPKMKGSELYEQIRRMSPTTRFLFVSGYQADKLGRDFVPGKGVDFLEKPFPLDRLAAKIRQALA